MKDVEELKFSKALSFDRLVNFILKYWLIFMSVSKGHSVSKLQKEINKELSNLKLKKNFSLTSLSCN